MQNPFDFLREEEAVVHSLCKMERAVDRAIKAPMEFIKTQTSRTGHLEGFNAWLKTHSRHAVPVTYKSELAIMIAIMLEWPKGQEAFYEETLDSFRRVTTRLVRIMHSKCFHRQYLYQALVHYEQCVFSVPDGPSFWNDAFVQERDLSAEEKNLCDEFDNFLECALHDDDISFLTRASANPMVKREKIRQLGVILSFVRHKGTRAPFETVIRYGLWMTWWAKLGEAHPSGPTYWCQLGDNVKHLLKTMCLWDSRHNSAHRAIKAGIRLKNVFLAGRVILNRHSFVSTTGQRVSFYATLPETRALKRKIEELGIVRDALEKRVAHLEAKLLENTKATDSLQVENQQLRQHLIRLLVKP